MKPISAEAFRLLTGENLADVRGKKKEIVSEEKQVARDTYAAFIEAQAERYAKAYGVTKTQAIHTVTERWASWTYRDVDPLKREIALLVSAEMDRIQKEYESGKKKEHGSN